MRAGCDPQPLAPIPAGTPLPNNPQLRLLDWRADYVPGTALHGIGALAYTAASEGAGLVPDSSSLLANAGSAGSAGGGGAGGDASGSGSGPEAAVLEELQRVLRAQDQSQLRSYVGLPSPASVAAAATGGDAEAAAAEPAMAGLRRYEPDAGELVVLLAARISGKPMTGADLLVVARREDGSTVLQLPDGWEAMLAMA